MNIRFLLSVAIIVFNLPVYACSCGPQEVEEGYQSSDFLFKGKVTSIDLYGTSDFHRVKVEVSDVYKKGLNEIEVIYTPQTEGACGFTFRENESYIVFGYVGSLERKDTVKDTAIVSLCSFTTPLNDGYWHEEMRRKKLMTT